MRTNLCPNPAVGVDTTDWVGSGSISRVAVAGFARPDAVELTGTGGSGEHYVLVAPGAASPGNEYTASVSFKVNAARTCSAYLIWYDAGNSVIGFVPSPENDFTTTTDVVERRYVTGTAPANTAYAGIQISMIGGADTLHTTMAMLEGGPNENAYADGNTAGWQWGGTAELSTSSEIPPPPPGPDLNAKWYLGIPGDLRVLTCPLPGISTTATRFGATKQAVTGARRMTTFGHRAAYTFRWDYMEKAEWAWLEALHHRHIPGPHRLISPLKKNRLTPDSASCRVSKAGLELTGGSPTRVWDWPSDVDPGAKCLRWASWVAGNVIRFDSAHRTAVFPQEEISGSVHLRAETAQADVIFLYFDFFDQEETQIGSSPSSTLIDLTTDWQVFSHTDTVPVDCTTVKMIMYADGASVPIRIAAPQVENGLPTDWEQGGAAPVVLTDQLETSSPRYPLTDCVMTLLEA